MPLPHLCCADRGKNTATLQLLSQALNSGVLNVSPMHNPEPATCQNTVYKKFAVLLLRDHTEENVNEFLKWSLVFPLNSLSLQAALLSLQVTHRHEIEISSNSLTLAGCLTAQTMRFTVNAELCCVGSQGTFLRGKIDISENH